MNKKNIAEQHGVDLQNYVIRNVRISHTNKLNCALCCFFVIGTLFFIVLSILKRNSDIVLTWNVFLGLIFFIGSLVFMDLLSQEIYYTDEKITYRRFFKKYVFNVSDIEYFSVIYSQLHARERIEISLKTNKKFCYEIASYNKENFIFLLNLLKLGVPQI